ncbi:MAG: hypothetical protein WAO00_19130 [Chthoniobacterales bacterium]
MEPATQNNVAAIGGWVIPLTAFALVTIIRLFMAPYWTWKEERDRARKLQDKLTDYDETPVFPIVEMPSSNEPIRVKLINKGRDDEPIEAVCLYLCDGGKNERFGIIEHDQDGRAMPLTMGRKTNLRVTFDLLPIHCMQWGVKSVFAVVSLQDGREREGDHYTIRYSTPLDELLAAPVTHAPGRTWEQSMIRHKRIHRVANAYYRARTSSLLAKNRQQVEVNSWRDLNDAQIRDLEDASEVSELLLIFEARNVRHPFKNGETPEAILLFYQSYIPEGVSIGGIVEWTTAYNQWFGASLPIPE